MKKTLVICLLCLSSIAAFAQLRQKAPLPDFSVYQESTVKRQAFIDYLLPRVDQANAAILKDRERLQKLEQQMATKHRLSRRDQRWVEQVAHNYSVKPFSIHSREAWSKLLERVDEVPTSLVIAQAAHESAWGTSRFAQEGANLFGEWCFKKGCGIVPKQRPEGARYEVKRFPDATASIQAYIHNLNTNRAYYTLRQMRQQARADNRPLSGMQLINGLQHYSERGTAYIGSIRAMILQNHLLRYDQV